MTAPTSRTINLTLWAAVAFLGLVGAAALWSIGSLREESSAAAQTERMLESAGLLRTRLSDTQAALLLYVATGDEHEVPGYVRDLAASREALAVFEAALDGEQRSRRGAELRALFDAQFRAMDTIVRLRVLQGFGAALEAVRSDIYQAQVRQGENLVEDITQARAAALEAQRSGKHRIGDVALVLVVGGGIVASAILLWADRMARRYRRQRDQSGAKLRESERFLRTITDNIPAMVSYIDADERYRYHNRIMLDWMAVKEEAINGRTVREVIGEPGYAVTGPYLKRALAGDVVRWERTQVGADGEARELDIVCVPDLDASGHVAGIYAFLTDVSEGKRLARLKNEFVSTVSHELRTPLTSIRGSLGLIEGGVAGVLPDKAKTLVSVAKNNCERLIRLINDILDIEKIESGKMDFDMKPLELMALVEQSLADNEGYARGHQCRYALAAVQPGAMVHGDRDRLLQVCANLLSNAAKFSPPGGVVDVSVERHAARLRVSVRDRGPGIPTAFRGRIFQKFSQADSSDTRKKGGSGLGLSIVKAIVESHGGAIGFDDVIENSTVAGTTFWFELPGLELYEADDGPACRLIAGLVAQSGAGLDARPAILHVEDDAGLRSVVAMLLDPFARTEAASTLAEARAKVAERRYDLVLLDLALPDGSGWDLFEEMRAGLQPAGAMPPVIVFSGSSIGPDHIGDVKGALVKAHSTDAQLVATIRQSLATPLGPSNGT